MKRYYPLFLSIIAATLILSCCTQKTTEISKGVPPEVTPTIDKELITPGPTENITIPSFTIDKSENTPPVFEKAQDILEWTNQLVHAYGGKMVVDGKNLNAQQLSEEIIKNIDFYLKKKIIAENTVYFLVINRIPLAVSNKNGYWKEATLRDFGDFLGIKMGTLIGDPYQTGIWDSSWWENEYHLGVAHVDNPSIPRYGEVDWDWTDWQLLKTEVNHLESRLHPVLFPNFRPAWVDKNVTQEDMDYMVRIIVEHAKVKGVTEIVVSNESTPWNDAYRNDIYWQKFGMGYILRAFRLTKEIYPEAKLIINDTGNHIKGSLNTETTKLIADSLYKEGLIDYVGVQMHIDKLNMPIKKDLIEIFKSYPVPVVITEFDALLTDLPATQQDEKMARITKIVFDGCLESGVCVGITTWGENDGASSTGEYRLRDVKNQRKSAYYAAMQTMYEHIP